MTTQEILDKLKEAREIVGELEDGLFNPRFKCGMLCSRCQEVSPNRYYRCHMVREIGTAEYYIGVACQAAKDLLEQEEKEE